MRKHPFSVHRLNSNSPTVNALHRRATFHTRTL